MVEQLARLVFRYRNALFPLLVGSILVVRPPVPLGERYGDLLWVAGVMLVALGQALRGITIGLKYIKRGGKDGRFFAPELVVGGIFAHCRNPMYVGNLLITTGFFVAAGDPIGIVAGSALFFALYATIVHGEERYLTERFGDAYRAYCSESPRWLVRMSGLGTTLAAPFDWRRLLNKEYGTMYVSLMAPAGILAWKIVRAGGWGQLEPYLPAFATYASLVGIGYLVVRVLKKRHRLDPPREESLAHGLAVGRAHIDRIDDDLLRLLNARARAVRRIYDLKERHHVPRFDATRTEEILERVHAVNEGPLHHDDVERLFRSILDAFLMMDQSEPASEPPSYSISIVPRERTRNRYHA
jgi:protein-S-isoprenylcysteine O-methyltransferase Ste14/chorismate mutase